MNMQLRYKGGFYSFANVLYEVEIFQEGYGGVVENIAFCDNPLEIKWAETDKIDPVQSSSATVNLYSDTDRQFIDMYTIRAGSVRMDVYRNGDLYWSGTLDPELYEEPFSEKTDYGVTLTFSDMAVLDRLSWERKGFMTIREIITETLLKSGIRYEATEEHISTRLSEYNTENILDALSADCDNFFDEDGDPMKLREVIEGVLRPFALRMIQRSGKVILYDLNKVYTSFQAEPVRWESNDAVLGVDKVYNNVKLTFSPYSKEVLIEGKVDPKSVGTERKTTTLLHTEAASSELGFYTYLSDTADGPDKNPKAKYFKIEPVFSGEESTGVAWTVRTFAGIQGYTNYLQAPGSGIGELLIQPKDKPFLPYIGLNRTNYKLKLNLSLLFDVRYNPFEEAHVKNEEGDWDRLKNWCNFAYVPFILTLRDASGNAIYHWQNKGVKESNSFVRAGCRWVAGEGSWGDAWMCWYQGDRRKESGLGGWQKNKQIIGYYRGEKLPILFDKMDPAEYIDMPDRSGYLELKIGTGIPCYDYGDDDNWQLRNDIYERVRWVMCKDPSVAIVDKNGKELANEDIEHIAWLNKEAKEELKIDTIIGTLKEPSPAARGQLFMTADKSVKNMFFRAGNSDLLERLLIGTVYSNYSDRHNTLSGTAAIRPEFGIYTDLSEPGKYLLIGETQHLRRDEAELSVVAFDQDNYKGVEFE